MRWKSRVSILAVVFVIGAAYARPYQCDELESAASDLESATQELLSCVSRHDYSDDCFREAREVRDAADTYESAVSDAEGTFDGETAEVCPAPKSKTGVRVHFPLYGEVMAWEGPAMAAAGACGPPSDTLVSLSCALNSLPKTRVHFPLYGEVMAWEGAAVPAAARNGVRFIYFARPRHKKGSGNISVSNANVLRPLASLL